MASFWDLLPASWPGQSLDPYLPFAAVPPAGGSKRAAPGVASAVPFGGSSIADDQAQSRPPTFRDLLLPPQLGQPFAPIMPAQAQRSPDPWLVATPQAGTYTAAAPQHGQPFVAMMPPRAQPDPWVSPTINPASMTPGAQAFFPGAARATDNPGFLGLALAQAAPAADQSPVTRQVAAGGAQAAPPAPADGLGTHLLAGAAAIRPITTYLPTQRQFALEGIDQMREGWRDYQRYLAARPSQLPTAALDEIPKLISPLRYFNDLGILKMAMGTANWLGSPINAAVHTVVGQPVEDTTGIPSKYTDFATGFALPFVKRLPGISGPSVESVRVPRVAPSALPDTAETAQGAPGAASDSVADVAPSPAESPALAGAPRYTREQADLIRNWLGIDPQRFRGTVSLDPARLEGELLDERGAPIGDIHRSISSDTGVAHHGYLGLNDEVQNAGLVKQLMRSNVDYYRQRGLSRVEVNAGLDRGGYAWARYGFVPTQESWDALRPMLRGKITDPSLNLTPAQQQKLLGILENPDPHTIWDIADIRTPMTIDGETLPLGNRLLSGKYWKGSLDLNDASTLERFYNYVGSNR